VLPGLTRPHTHTSAASPTFHTFQGQAHCAVGSRALVDPGRPCWFPWALTRPSPAVLCVFLPGGTASSRSGPFPPRRVRQRVQVGLPCLPTHTQPSLNPPSGPRHRTTRPHADACFRRPLLPRVRCLRSPLEQASPDPTPRRPPRRPDIPILSTFLHPSIPRVPARFPRKRGGSPRPVFAPARSASLPPRKFHRGHQ
jgi:hypothetical protein